MRLINADDVTRELCDSCMCSRGTDCGPDGKCLEVAVIDSAPTVDAEPVMHGKWIDTELTINYLFFCTCSVCGEKQIIEVANYCPMCGAKMDGEEEEK